jgi:transcriptional regulator with XRE-family HTH domain
MNRIKEVLEEKGIKQTWLAEQLGKSYNMVNGYVQNRQQPRLEILYEIAKILEVNVKDLLEPLELSWKERRTKELALMEDLVPQLKKLAEGREISGLAAYE